MEDNVVQREPHSLKCCCCRTTTAAKIVGWLDVIGSIIVIILCIVIFAMADDYNVVYEDIAKIRDILILIVFVGLLLTSIILLVGIGCKSAPACLPYIIYKALQIIGGIGFIIWLYVEFESKYGVHPHIIFTMIWFIGILWDIYQLAVTTHCFFYLNGLGSQSGFARQQQVVPMQAPYGNAYEGYGQQQAAPMQTPYDGDGYEVFGYPPPVVG